MASTADSLPTDLAAAHAMIIAQREALVAAEARATAAESEARYRALVIEKLNDRQIPAREVRAIFGTALDRAGLLGKFYNLWVQFQWDTQ